MRSFKETVFSLHERVVYWEIHRNQSQQNRLRQTKWENNDINEITSYAPRVLKFIKLQNY